MVVEHFDAEHRCDAATTQVLITTAPDSAATTRTNLPKFSVGVVISALTAHPLSLSFSCVLLLLSLSALLLLLAPVSSSALQHYNIQH